MTLAARITAQAGSRLRYRWDNTDSPVLDGVQRLAAPAQAYRAMAQTATLTTGSGALTIAYVGIRTGLRTILPLAEQLTPGHTGRTTRSEVAHGSVRALCARAARTADIVIVGGPYSSLDQSGLDVPSIDAPFRVHLVRHLPPDAATLLAQVSRREREAFRKSVREHGFVGEITQDASRVREFYETMHLPTMRRRHGTHALTETLTVAERELLARGFLFLVRSGDQDVAGALCTYDRLSSTVTTRLLGVPGGEQRHYDSGAFKALYHLLSDWCRQRGVSRLDLFATQAWTAKGLFQWKRRLHPQVVLPPNRYKAQRIRIHVLRDRDIVRDFLVGAPLLTLDEPNGGFVATWFHDARRPCRDDVKVGLPGVAAERVVDLDDLLHTHAAGTRSGPRSATTRHRSAGAEATTER